MRQAMAATRLDMLWQAIEADREGDRPWLDFYEGFATARLHLALDGAEGDRVRPTLLPLAEGRAAIAFDSEDRFAAVIGRPTEHAVLTGADLAALMASQGIALALNPGIEGGCQTVLEPDALDWIARHLVAGPSEEAVARGRLGPPASPEPELLDALARRVADLGAAVGEAWLAGLAEAGDEDELILVVRLEPGSAALAPEIMATLTRTGQTATARRFAVAPAEDGAAILAAARRHGIGLGA
ncbi:SseB family protein [Limibaculum sp. M0105]|uniref:SseB family protein n=1 Tax=Thermohalobaculum xanthum TaxID=2753746 RepID=A0A8J7SEU4_9RHOB|nr:SseB family protein [Thermohalobaculum xanthum]MBK0398075.1 SseB family protein [Thermohalobaculum xanthum]